MSKAFTVEERKAAIKMGAELYNNSLLNDSIKMALHILIESTLLVVSAQIEQEKENKTNE